MQIARERLRIAIQKSGRLSEKSFALFSKCGLTVDPGKERLLFPCPDFPVDFLLVRDDDIPEYVADGVCDLGVVGQNVLEEGTRGGTEILRKLGFGRCRLSIGVPVSFPYEGPKSLQGKRIATTYPNGLARWLSARGIEAKVVELSGSVEVAPNLGVADFVCDLVSSGGTLQANGLREAERVFESEAVLVKSGKPFSATASATLERLLRRMDGVLSAASAKYIMMNAPATALQEIRKILPGMEAPSILNLDAKGEKIAIHAVATEGVFWDTIERLKEVGASSILVLPIEKVIA